MSRINSEGNIIVKCEVKDNSMNKVISDSSSQERLEVGDSMNLNENVETNSSNYSEIFGKLSNTPFNWDLTIYEKFRDLCKESIRQVYTQNDISSNDTVENCYKTLLTPLRLLRFLLGFNFNLYNAHNSFNKHIQWRKEFNMDTVVRPYVITNMIPNNNIEMAPLHNIITRYYPCNLLLRESTNEKTPLRDNFGNVICIERFGLLDETRLLGAVKVEELLLWYSYHMEYRSVLLDKLSYESKSLIRATCIMDLYGLSVSQVHSSHMITILRRMIQLASDNYPEGMSYVIFVNAPKFFSIVWNSFKALLAARTVEKILVLDDDYKTKLLTIIPIGNLPQFLGGLTTDQYSTVPNTGTLLLDCFGLGDDRQTLHIKRMKKEKITISIVKPNTVIYWTWGVLEGEIGFSAKFIIDSIGKSDHNGDQNIDQIVNDDKLNIISTPNVVNIDDNNAKLIFPPLESPNLDDSIIDLDMKSDLKKNPNSIKKSSKVSSKYPNIQESNIVISPQSSLQQEITIVPSSRFDSTKAYGGSYFVENPGYLTLQWDNSWSFFSGKTVHFVIKTSNSTFEENDDSQDDVQNTKMKDLSNIKNLISHNVALKTTTKKRPSKSHKSVDKKKNSKNNRSSNKPAVVLNEDFHSNEEKIRKTRKDEFVETCNKFNDMNIETGQGQSSSLNNNLIENKNLYASNPNSHLLNVYNRDSSVGSECRTDTSFITANSGIDEIIDMFEFNKCPLINSNDRVQDKAQDNEAPEENSAGIPEYTNTENETSESELSNNSSNIQIAGMIDCDILLNSLSSVNSSSMDSCDEICSQELNYIKNSNGNKYSRCRKSIETRIDIYGFDNFGIEMSQINIKRQNELNNYLKNDLKNSGDRNKICGYKSSTEPKGSSSWRKKLSKMLLGRKSKTSSQLESNSSKFRNTKRKRLINIVMNRFRK